MTPYSRRSAFTLLCAIVFLALIQRYPSTHESGVDSFAIDAWAQMIVKTGSMGWLVSPLSYVGLAPFSYPAAVPVSLAFLSSLSSLNLEATVLVYSLFLGTIVVLSGFVLGHAVLRTTRGALLTSFLVSSAGGVIGFTDWTVSTRGTFVVFMPIALAFLVKPLLRRGSRSSKDWLPLVSVSLVMVLVHALWLIFLPVVLAAFMLFRILVLEDATTRYRIRRKPRLAVTLASACAVSVGLAVMLISQIQPEALVSSFPTIRTSAIPDNLLTRAGLYLGTVVGIGILAVPLGLIRLREVHNRSQRLVVIALTAVFFPVAIDPVYGILVAMPVVLAIAAIGLCGAPNSNRDGTHRRRFLQGAVVFLFALSIVAVPAAVTVPRSSGSGCVASWVLPPQTYNTGVYLKTFDPSGYSFLASDPVDSERIEAVSGAPSVEPILSIGTLMFPQLAARTPVRFITPNQPFASLINRQQLLDASEWIPVAGLQYPYYWGKHTQLLLESADDSPVAQGIMQFYGTRFVIDSCGSYQSPFMSSIRGSVYRTYMNELESIYQVSS